jgi:crotonobetainyl-CoA:carnitine CoA-transferase CaiB-like acyl-CoA transferase
LRAAADFGKVRSASRARDHFSRPAAASPRFPGAYVNEATAGPLAGIKVLELGTLIAGPLCSRMLGDFGAEVIKIEAPEGGDQLRQWRKMYEGTSLWWYTQARNKKSVTLNLR